MNSSHEKPFGSLAAVRGRLLILTAAVGWSSSGFFAEAPDFDGWSGPVLAFWRAVFASIVLVPLVRQVRWSLKLIPLTLIFAAMNFTYLSAIEHGNATQAIWLQNTAPVWVFLIGVFCFHEPAAARDWLLLVFCTLGVAVILAHEARASQLGGVTYGILAGLTYGGVVLALRQLRDYDSAWLIAISHLATALLLSPWVIHARVYEHLWPSGRQWVLLACFGMLQMGIPYLLFAKGLRFVVGHEASGIVLLEPVLVPVWVYLAWSSSPTYRAPHWTTFLGGGLILCGLVLRYLRTSRAGAAANG